MKKTAIKVVTRNGIIDWPAYQSATPGLAVTKSPYLDWDRPYSRWRIYHLDSGKVIPGCEGFKTRKDAESVAIGLGKVLDWTQDESKVILALMSTDIYRIRRTALNRVGY